MGRTSSRGLPNYKEIPAVYQYVCTRNAHARNSERHAWPVDESMRSRNSR